MCGVIGLIQKNDTTAPKKVLSALKIMEYRGYDSWGVAWGEDTGHGVHAVVHKQVGQIGSAKLPESAVGNQAIGHTRWATHGGVTAANAHPHLSRDGRFALVQNGILENFQSLKNEMIDAGYEFKTETDTEVILAVWEDQFKKVREKAPNLGVQQHILKTAQQCFARFEGSNAVVVMDFVAGMGVAIRLGSPLILGKSSSLVCAVSDILALVDVAQLYVPLDNHELALFTAEGAKIYSLITLLQIVKNWQPLRLSSAEVSKGTHTHYLQKEIFESSSVVSGIIRNKKLRNTLRKTAAGLADTVYLVGCGTAYHAALYGAQVITQQTMKTAFAFSANEFESWADKVGQNSVIFISQSGETADILVHARKLSENGISFFAMVNREQSSLADLASQVIPILAGPEQAVVASKSFTAQLSILLLLVAEINANRNFKELVLQSMKQAVVILSKLVTSLPETKEWQNLVAQLSVSESTYLLGRGSLHPLALEFALKLKEAAYLHAEGFSAGELKHGVLALIESGTPVISLATDPTTRSLDSASAQEVKAREGQVFSFSDQRGSESDSSIIVIHNIGIATPLLVAVAGQLLAYTVACAKGINPDKPRNLAKSVTVR